MNTDRDIKRRLGTTLGLTAFVIVGAAIASSIGEDREYSATHDPDLYPSSGEIYPSKNEISVEQLSKKELSRKQLEEEGYDCAIIPEGSHLTQELTPDLTELFMKTETYKDSGHTQIYRVWFFLKSIFVSKR